MKRLTKEEYVCLLALSASTRSEDFFTQTGAALLDVAGNVLGTGFNGLKAGMSVPDWMNYEGFRNEKSKLMLHSEVNLWLRKKEGIEHLMGISMSPCLACAKLIAASQVKKVVFVKKYERGTDEYKEIFDFYGIEHRLLTKQELTNISSVLTNLGGIIASEIDKRE